MKKPNRILILMLFLAVLLLPAAVYAETGEEQESPEGPGADGAVRIESVEDL